MITEAQIAQEQAELFRAIPPSILQKLAGFFRDKAMLASYACSQIGAPEDFRLDCLATVRVCHGFADKAEEALSARRAEATAQARGDST